jgi:hypothetical protein
MDRRRFLKQAGIGSMALASVPALQQALATSASASGGAAYVRWDIQSLDFSTTPITERPGGMAFASADPDLKIKLTGAGTFVAPASGGTSNAVTGGGTWETFEAGVSADSGTYQVTGLVSWQFANMQTNTPPFTDAIGDPNQRANGNAVLRIAYSDGSEGILGLGCEGPGAPEGIQEGIIATKGYSTYWTREAPLPLGTKVDKNRTIFHVMR